MKKKINVRQLPDRIVLINLYLSQFILFVLGVAIMLLLQRRTLAELPLWTEPLAWCIVLWGVGLAAVVLLIDAVIYANVPKHVLDDGGMNEKVFLRRPIWHIAIICACVAICEEFLFRGVIQHSLGIYMTSLLFAGMHWRYFKRWYLSMYVFLISCGLGWIYIKSGSLWAPITAHFLIDFVLGCFIHWKGGAVRHE